MSSDEIMKDVVSKKTKAGVVVSGRMHKTIVVEVSRTSKDPRLKKVLRFKKRYKVHHDSDESVAVGDFVEIYEGRPVSKTKFMYFNRVISRVG